MAFVDASDSCLVFTLTHSHTHIRIHIRIRKLRWLGILAAGVAACVGVTVDVAAGVVICRSLLLCVNKFTCSIVWHATPSNVLVCVCRNTCICWIHLPCGRCKLERKHFSCAGIFTHIYFRCISAVLPFARVTCPSPPPLCQPLASPLYLCLRDKQVKCCQLPLLGSLRSSSLFLLLA